MTRTSNVFAKVEPEVKEQLDAEIAKGMADVENGRVYSASVDSSLKGNFIT